MKKINSLIAKVIFAVAIALIPAATIFAQTVQTYNSSTTWTCPAGVSAITVEVYGGGGGGGSSANTTTNGGSGGGGGAYSKTAGIAVTPSTVYTVTAGAAGTAAPASSTTAAGAGGDSWFSTSGTILAKGGGAGGNNGGAAGAGGAAASGIGTIKFSGGSTVVGGASAGSGGGSSAGTAANGNAGTVSNGGAAPAGGGAGGNAAPTNPTNGQAGFAPGGGGGGADDVAASAGGAGAAGRVILTYSTITSYSPTFACVGSTPIITINGTGFTGITSVTFNGLPAAWSPVSTTQITATVPNGATTGPIQITTSYGVCFSTNFTISPLVPVTVTISAVAPSPNTGTGPFTACNGTTYYFQAVVTNGGTTPFIQWYDGATPIGTNSVNLTYAITSGSAVNCQVTYGGTGVNCPDGVPGASNTVAFNPVATPSQPPSPTGLSTVCANQTGVTYTTSAAGASTYTWTTPGGTIMTGQGTGTITVNWGSTAGSFTMTVTPYNICGTAGPVRNKIITVNALAAPPALTISDAAGGPTTICQYFSINFSATISEASLQKTAYWKVDGVTQFTAGPTTGNAFFLYPNGGSFNYGFATAGVHTVQCVIKFAGQPAPGQCYNPDSTVSNTITYTVTQNEPPQVSITDVANGNNICRGTLDVITAVPIDAGTPTYAWYVDAVLDPSCTTAVYNYIPATAGVHFVYCDVISSQPCDNSPPISNPVSSSNIVFVNVDPCTYYVPVTGTLGPYSACGGAFYDSQLDPGAMYANNVNGTTIFCSALPSQYVSITFTSMALTDNTDILRLYSGTGTGGPLLQTFTGPLNTTSFCGAVVSQDLSAGCITVWFQTGSSGQGAGWDGSIACSPTTSATPAGTTCANPTVISVLPYTASNHTTQCLLNDYTNQAGICNTSYNGEDHVYVYTTTGPECTSIAMSGTTGSPALAIYQGCPGAGGTCLTPTPMVGNNSMQFTFPVAATYYIIVDEASGYSNYTMNIQTFGLAPPNDLPCNAQSIPLLVNVNGNNTCTGSASEPGQPSCWTGGTMHTTWYSFVAPASGSVRIRTTPGSIISTQIALYSGPCNSVTLVSSGTNCNQSGPTCASVSNFPSSEIAVSGLTSGSTYYVRVDGRNSQTGNYNIVVADQTGQQPYATGQDCLSPMTVCANNFTLGNPGFQNTGWVCDYASGNNTCMASGDRQSAWYVIDINANGNFTFALTPNGPTDYDWVLCDITSFGPDQQSRILAACAQINNSNNLPWVRCNWSAPITYAPCASSQYVTGMCASATNTTAGGGGPNFSSVYPVTAGMTLLLNVSNFSLNASGFNLNFNNNSNTSPIAYSPPTVLYWTAGANNTDWFNVTNWGNCGPPDCGTEATILIGSSFYPVLNNGQLATVKDLKIEAGANFTMNGTAQLDICGNFRNVGNSLVASTSTFNLINSAAQYFDGNLIGSSKFGNIKMSKSASGSSKLTFNDNAQMDGTLTLANTGFGGKIVTGIFELYITNNSPSASNFGSPTSYVEGNLRRNLDGTLSSATYYFPLGHATPGFQLATIDFTSTHSIPSMFGYFSTWSSLPGPTGLMDGGACPVTYSTAPGFYDNGYWTLTASANASSANYNLQLRNAGYTNGPGTNWTVAKAATTAGPWSLSGACTAVASPFAKRTGMNGFSVFATAQTSTAFPVSLLNFDAVTKGTGVMTTWITSSEINNDYFIVERSSDGIHFVQIGTRKGAGNSSSTLYYSMIDPSPLKGLSYYRLSQVDFDGSSSKSEVVAVSFLETNVLNVYPNPATDATSYMTYEFNSSGDGLVRLEIVDMLGRVVITQNVNATKGANKFEKENGLNVSFLPHGVYIMQLKPVNSEIIEPMQKRFVKQTKEE